MTWLDWREVDAVIIFPSPYAVAKAVCCNSGVWDDLAPLQEILDCYVDPNNVYKIVDETDQIVLPLYCIWTKIYD